MTLLTTIMLNLKSPERVSPIQSEYPTSDIIAYFYAMISGELCVWEINNYPVLGSGDMSCDRCGSDLADAYWYCPRCHENFCNDCNGCNTDAREKSRAGKRSYKYFEQVEHCQHQCVPRNYESASEITATQFEFGSIMDWMPLREHNAAIILKNYNRDSPYHGQYAIMYESRGRLYYHGVTDLSRD